jgi:tetratricopeptide (TPR) repeat protein
MFRRVAGKQRTAAEPKAVEVVVQLCGHLPLALRIAGARLRERPAWTVADLVTRLENQARRGKFLEVDGCNLMDVLQVSYRHLRPQEQRVFRLLSLQAGADFDKYAAAALTGLPVEQTEDILESLLDDNLLRQDTRDRFNFHNLVRDCAHDLCTQHDNDQDREAARRLMLDYYVHATYEWTRSLPRLIDFPPEVARPGFALPAPETGVNPIELMDRDFGNVIAAAQMAADNNLGRHARQLVRVSQPYMRSRNYDGSSHKLCEVGIAMGRADEDEVTESTSLQGLAAFHRERGSTAESHAYLEAALKISRAIGNDVLQMSQLGNLGILYADDDRLAEALAVNREAEKLAAALGQTTMLFILRNNLSAITRDLGEFKASLEYVSDALDLADPSKGPMLGPIMPTWNMAIATYFNGDHRKAEDIYTRMLADSTKTEDKFGESIALVGLSVTRRSLGDPQAALEYGRRSLAVSRQLGRRRQECERSAASARRCSRCGNSIVAARSSNRH